MPTKVTKGFLSPISQLSEETAIGGNHDYVCVVCASRCHISRIENGRSTATSRIGYSVPSLMLLTLLAVQPVPERNLSIYRHIVFQATKGKLFS
jgi:hypothetical protein